MLTAAHCLQNGSTCDTSASVRDLDVYGGMFDAARSHEPTRQRTKMAEAHPHGGYCSPNGVDASNRITVGLRPNRQFCRILATFFRPFFGQFLIVVLQQLYIMYYKGNLFDLGNQKYDKQAAAPVELL